MEKLLIEICNPKQWKTISTSKLLEDGYNVYGANGIIGYYDQYTHEKPTLMITCRGATCGTLNISEPFSYINGNAMALDNLDESINMKYLYYFLMNRGLEDAISGSAQPQITRAGLSKVKVCYPNINVQEKIVEVLEKTELLINIRKRQIEQLNLLVKSKFIEMFGDPVSNPMGWEKRKLADECNIITGNTPSRKIDEYYGDYIEWIKSDNITNAGTYLTTAKEYLSEEGLNVGRSVEQNSILMTCIAGSLKCIGNVAIADRKVSFNQQINGIETLDNNVFFMFEQFNLSQAYIQSTINMALKGILSKSQLSELEFIFPPIELQNEFANFFKQVDKLKFEMEKSLKELEGNFNSLMQRAFKGELFS